MNLLGKTCLITGANSGMGLAAAKQFAKLGANVVLVCRDSSKGNAAVMKNLQMRCILIQERYSRGKKRSLLRHIGVTLMPAGVFGQLQNQ